MILARKEKEGLAIKLAEAGKTARDIAPCEIEAVNTANAWKIKEDGSPMHIPTQQKSLSIVRNAATERNWHCCRVLPEKDDGFLK